MHLFNPGDPFPRLTMNVLGGEVLTVPDAFAGDFATLLFYRGAWYPHCNAQLGAFQRAGQGLADAGIRVAAVTGAFVNPDPVYLQSTGFVLDPPGTSWLACTPAAPSAGSSPRTSSASSGTCASTRQPRRHELETGS
jgi:hypothetical protein